MTMRETEFVGGQENVLRGNFRKNFLVRLVARVRTWNERRKAIQTLHGMSDTLLRDLGIERYEIEDVVRRGGEYTVLKPVRKSSAVAPLKKAAA
jgi:uncharacterized protein YjiS (DUF1127 family)